MSDPFYLNISPGLAYYFLLSTAPVVLLFNYMANFFFSGTNLIVSLMRNYLPAQISSILIPFFSQQNQSSGFLATLIFFAITLYLSTRGMYTLIKVADYATDNLIQASMRDVPMAMFRRFLKSLALTLLLILLVVLSLVFFVFGRTVLDVWVSHVEVGVLSDLIYRIYRLFALPVVMALSFLILTFIYSRMPATNLPYREVLPGSITATIGIMVASIAYLIYIRYFFRLDAIFGALTSIIVLILWFFMMSFMLVFGIIVNVAFRDTRAEK
ncbi:MAG: YihY/virulence factor BrkB family protein [Firmicutes bacterium]|nr:YihY/virulence factor BrkB family protein [Bacillota bacterium]